MTYKRMGVSLYYHKLRYYIYIYIHVITTPTTQKKFLRTDDAYMQRRTSIDMNKNSMKLNAKITASPWWRHQMETFSALLGICAGNSPVPGEFPSQKPVTRSFDVFFDLSRNKRLSKQSRGWWFEIVLPPSWRHCNDSRKSIVNCRSQEVDHFVEATTCWTEFRGSVVLNDKWLASSVTIV